LKLFIWIRLVYKVLTHTFSLSLMLEQDNI